MFLRVNSSGRLVDCQAAGHYNEGPHNLVQTGSSGGAGISCSCLCLQQPQTSHFTAGTFFALRPTR